MDIEIKIPDDSFPAKDRLIYRVPTGPEGQCSQSFLSHTFKNEMENISSVKH